MRVMSIILLKEGNSYGLSNYDHIVQDGEDVKEDEVVFLKWERSLKQC